MRIPPLCVGLVWGTDLQTEKSHTEPASSAPEPDFNDDEILEFESMPLQDWIFAGLGKG